MAFPSALDGLRLSGWLLPAHVESIIILIHGEKYHRNDPKIKMLTIAEELVDRGYSVLMFDTRGHGESEGSRLSGGYHERRDVIGAVDFAKTRGYKDIGLLGFSMGAVAGLLAAAESEDIDAVVSDSSFAALKDIMTPEFRRRTPFPDFFLPRLLFLVKLFYGIDFSAIKPENVVPLIAPRPLYFIHGELDDVIPQEQALRLKERARSSLDRLWIASDAGHVMAFSAHPTEYIERINEFFTNTFDANSN